MIKKTVDTSRISREDFAQIKKKWRYELVGDESNSVDNPMIRVLLDSITERAKESWESMNKKDDAEVLFGTKPVESTNEMSKQYRHMWNMARAYGTYGTPFYKDVQMKEDVLYALEWLYNHYYGPAEIDGRGWRSVFLWNWWDWHVPVPTAICDTLMVMEDEVSRSAIYKYLMSYDYIRTLFCTGKVQANAGARVYASTEAAVLKEDPLLMLQCLEDLDILHQLKLPGEGAGVMKDYSYVNHFVFAMEGMYGTSVLIHRLAKTASALVGTKFQVNSEEVYNQFLWMEHTFRPVMHNGVLFTGVCGRGPSHGIMRGRGVIVGALYLLGSFGEEEDKVLKTIIRQNVKKEHLGEVIPAIGSIALAERLLAVMEEDFDVPVYERGMMRYGTDRAVQHRMGPNGKGYAVSLNMTSERMGRYECINHCNTEGWYQGDGTLYVYTELTDGKQDEFGLEYFNEEAQDTGRPRSSKPYANMHRLPGTTEDMRQREPISIFHPIMGARDFVGGAELEGQYIAAAYDFEAYHYEEADDRQDTGMGGGFPQIFSDLTAKKSYFMFDDEIVAVGSDICTTNEDPVNTYIDNRALFWSKDPAGCDITVDGCLYKDGGVCNKDDSVCNRDDGLYKDGSVCNKDDGSACEGGPGLKEKCFAPSWIHLGCFGGYYLPMGGETVINVTEGERRFFELWIPHGKKPQKAKYAYVMLPGRTPEETAAYSENPDVEILECTQKLHVVKEKKLKITAMVFWEAGTYGDITVDIPCVVMLRECDGELRIAVSDPTQKERKAQMVIERNCVVKDADPRIGVESIAEKDKKTVLTMDFTDTRGETLQGIFWHSI